MNQEEQYVYHMQRLEKSAFFVGVASIPSLLIFPIAGPFMLGSSAILLAVLSKGGNLKFSKRARIAFILGLVAIVLNIGYLCFTLFSLRLILSDPEGRQQLSDIIYQRYGMTLEDVLRQLPQQSFIQ